jgi:hypothetical protein
MADSNLSEGVNRLSREIAELPARATVATRQGFAIASALSEIDRQKAVELMLASVQRSRAGFDTEAVSNELNLPRRDAGRLMTALSVTLGLLSDNVASLEEFAQAARDTIFEAASEPAVRAIADIIIRERPTLAKAMARHQLAAEVLPSLVEFDVTVDLRIRFNDDKADEFVSVAVVHIDTDGNNQELWLQLSKSDINTMLETLNKAAREMDLAENLLSQVIK